MSKQQQDGATNEQLQTKPKTKISTLEERILEVEKQMAVLNGGTIAEKKSSEPELAAEEKMGEVQIAIEYNNPRKAVNFLRTRPKSFLPNKQQPHKRQFNHCERGGELSLAVLPKSSAFF